MDANFWKSITRGIIEVTFFLCFWLFGEVTKGTYKNGFESIPNEKIILVEERCFWSIMRGGSIPQSVCFTTYYMCFTTYYWQCFIKGWERNELQVSDYLLHSCLWHIKTSRKQVMDSRLETQLGNYFCLESGELVKSNSLCLIAWVHEASNSVFMLNSSSVTPWKYYVQIKHI